MSNFFSDPTSTRIVTEADLVNIISNFSEDITKDIIESNIFYMFNNVYVDIANLVNARETSIQMTIANNGNGSFMNNDLMEARHNFHIDILTILNDKFQVVYTGDQLLDLFTPASILYDLMISGFRQHLIDFFTNYILVEKTNIYNEMILARFKKQKDSTTLYNKQSIEDQELAIILSNLDFVISNMESFGFTFNNFINYAFYYNKPLANYINSVFEAGDLFYSNNIYSYFKTSARSNLETDILWNLDTNLKRIISNPSDNK